ncbi:hypothetical protein O7632_22115 [Solwaraspora sp. WMMD406]|uniref:hypothetical protein n=1 Tax=Solwaraspora sp. WMMD406 TaxID=3016095 RepID=UPI0024180CA3|nr:hypothetical protein [Solwaraspora sp. WMMD406]MDG4766773.1 hypothetical protein [Solwaraspora sp. WMMD406]
MTRLPYPGRVAGAHHRRPGPLAVSTLLVVLVTTLIAGCGPGGLGDLAGSGGGGGPAGGSGGDQQHGYAPKPDDSVVYQPDVVFVDGGGAAIRSVSEDGFTYVIDGDADGADQLEPGKVMFLTSEALGRVVRAERSGGDLAVTLAPVELTDVVRDGRFTFDQALDLESQTFEPLPDLLGEVVDDGAGTDTPVLPDPEAAAGLGVNAFGASDDLRIAVPPIALAPIRALAPGGTSGQALAGARAPVSMKRTVGGWAVTAYGEQTKLGLSAQHGTAATGLVVDFDIHLLLRDLRVSGDLRVTNGVLPQPKLRVDGLEALSVTIAAGAQNGLSDNKKARVELPIELKQNIIIGGFPATLKQTFKFLVETAFTAKNGNISATGQWGLTGPIGYDGGVLTPQFSVMKSIMQSLSGVSVGVEAIVVAIEFRFGLMIGLPVAGAGPFVGVVASIGLTNGSAAGRVGLPLAGPAVKCRGTTLVVTVRTGGGLNVSEPLQKAIEIVLDYKIPTSVDFLSADVINRTVVEPDVPLCRG